MAKLASDSPGDSHNEGCELCLNANCYCSLMCMSKCRVSTGKGAEELFTLKERAVTRVNTET